MLVIRKLKKLENGEYEASWKLTSEEAGYLLSYAINSLIGEGIVKVEEEFVDSGEDKKQLELDFLASIPPNYMGNA